MAAPEVSEIQLRRRVMGKICARVSLAAIGFVLVHFLRSIDYPCSGTGALYSQSGSENGLPSRVVDIPFHFFRKFGQIPSSRDCKFPSSLWSSAATSTTKLGNEEAAAGMRLLMTRMHHNPSGIPRSSPATLNRALERDSRRVHGRNVRLLSSSTRRNVASRSKSRSGPNFRASFPDLVDPEDREQQSTSTNGSLDTGTGKYNFEATVESGVSEGSGEYFVDLYVGTPPRHFSVIIDTGSDLTWIQCDPCELCYHQEGPVFQPAASSSYQGLTCNSESCLSAQGYGEDVNSCQKASKHPGVCKYFYYYGDQSNTTGDYAWETVTFNVSRGDSLQIEQILFGCGHSNIGLFQGSGGLLGLGQGDISFVSQVGNLFGDKFSYCLVDRDYSFDLGSPLVFGEDSIYDQLQQELQWTPFLNNTPMNTFYYINVTGVSVAGEPLDIPETAWEIDVDGGGGTIIDSGTTLSYFRQEAYDAIREAMESRISYPKVSVPVLRSCYNLTDVDLPNFPSFSVTFQGNSTMDLPSRNYFIRPDPAENIYCLAVLGVPSSNLNIIGNFQQQNYHVVYDRKNSRLGFAAVECAGIL